MLPSPESHTLDDKTLVLFGQGAMASGVYIFRMKARLFEYAAAEVHP
jgi:hypothetical protein